MSDLKKLTEKVIEFRDARDWQQFHNPKDLALSLTLEAAEVLEHFQWKTPEEIEEYIKKNKEEIAEEVVDVLKYLLLLAHELEINLVDACQRKMEKDGKNYPVEKAKGRHTKYNEL